MILCIVSEFFFVLSKGSATINCVAVWTSPRSPVLVQILTNAGSVPSQLQFSSIFWPELQARHEKWPIHSGSWIDSRQQRQLSLSLFEDVAHHGFFGKPIFHSATDLHFMLWLARWHVPLRSSISGRDSGKTNRFVSQRWRIIGSHYNERTGE